MSKKLDLSNVRTLPKIFFGGFILKTSVKGYAFPFRNLVFLHPDFYYDLHSDNPKPLSLSLLTHERVHLKRAKEKGRLCWSVLYILSKKFRFNEEVAAYSAMKEVLEKYGESYDWKRIARALSGWTYFFCINYKEALFELTK